MALTKADKEFIAQSIAQALAPAKSAPVTPKAESSFVTEVLRGRVACQADDGKACNRTLRTAARAFVHDDGTLGHIARVVA